MSTVGDYAKRISRAENRYEAADLLRAWGLEVATYYTSHFSTQAALAVIKTTHDRARKREAPLLQDDLIPDPLDPAFKIHPWQAWLKEWGFDPAGA